MKAWFAAGGLLLLFFSGYAQVPNWQNLDLKSDSVFGTSIEKAYKELLGGKKSSPVIVAVIDNGVDTSHEDLQPVIWTNTKEIPGNGIDDDHNGYVDDIHGWNFIGSETGLEDVTILAGTQKNFYDSLSYTRVPDKYRSQYSWWRKLWADYLAHIENAKKMLREAIEYRAGIEKVTAAIGKDNPGIGDFKKYHAKDEPEKKICSTTIYRLPFYADYRSYFEHEIGNVISQVEYHISHGLQYLPEENYTDEHTNSTWRYYGNNDVAGPATLLPASPDPDHGTHIAGIIAAVRNNNKGIQGIADHVLIMPVRLMSFYRELRDHDLANAIRYAVDNGASIINLSFGKMYTCYKPEVDSAVKYAMQKDVLIVHAIGNGGLDIEDQLIYPNSHFADSSGTAKAWIEVGASAPKDDNTLIASFSNYGQTKVDVFAPGAQIVSTVPNSKYQSFGGTSMAAPVVAGIAALVREYYPKLTALQVKDIIMKSVIKRPVLAGKCISGGVVNAYHALKLADTYH